MFLLLHVERYIKKEVEGVEGRRTPPIRQGLTKGVSKGHKKK
jgi:hypothetical protein